MTDELSQLAGAYFHQDYDLEYDDADSAILGFVEGHSGTAVRDLVLEIESLLATSQSESQFADLWINTLFASYAPDVDGWTYRDWFLHVLDLLGTPETNGGARPA